MSISQVCGQTFNAPGYDLQDLLDRAGAKPARYGRRWDCPFCGKRGHVSVDFPKGVFHCWHAGCDFKGNAFTLARSLGLTRTCTPEEAQAIRHDRERAQSAARAFVERLHQHRLERQEAHRSLLRIQDRAVEKLMGNMQDETAWSALAYTYSELSRISTGLLLLEDGPIGDRLAFLNSDESERQEKVDQIILAGGLADYEGRFIGLA